MTRNRGPLCVLGCYVIWGVLPIFWHMLAAVDALYVLSARIVASVAFLLVLLAARRRLGTVAEACRDRGALVRMMLSGVFICINWGVYIWAVNGGHALDASLAYYMNPILAVVLGTAYPATLENGPDGKKRSTQLTQDFQRRFTERFRKLDCHDLLAEKDIEGTPTAQELGVTQHCRLLVVSGVELLSDMLDELEAR